MKIHRTVDATSRANNANNFDHWRNERIFYSLGSSYGIKIKDKQAGLNDESKKIVGLIIRATIRIFCDIVALNVIL